MNDTAIFIIGLVVSGLVAAFVVMAYAAMRADPHED
jgi:general stress protein CsbA